MTGYKKYPHVPCDSVVVNLGQVRAALICHLESVDGGFDDCNPRKELAREIEAIDEIIAYRGTMLSVQRRRGRFSGHYLKITR